MAEVKTKKISTVITIGGEELPRTKCRKIRGNFYKVGRVNEQNSGECFRVPDDKGVVKYRTLEKGTVLWDNNLKKYVHKSLYGKIRVVIGPSMESAYEDKNDDQVVGFSVADGKVVFRNHEAAILNGFKEKISEAVYYSKNEYSAAFFTEKPIPDSDYKRNLDYGCERYMTKAKLLFDKNFKVVKIDSYIEKIYNTNKKLFDSYTFGLEFETTRGVIPQSICDKYGIMTLRDGSISGLEYATIPLQGKEGLYALKHIGDEVFKRTDFDLSCSLHIHVGGFERNETNTLALFKMMFSLQDEIYDLFPVYKKRNMGVKRMDYTAPLPTKVMMKMNYKNEDPASIKKDLSHLIHYLSGYAGGYDGVALKDIQEHPYNPSNNRKWQMSARYLWFNLLPLIFTNKKTAEFRIFGMPERKEKLFNFLIMSLSLIDFTVKNSEFILKNPVKRDGLSLLHSIHMSYRNSEFVDWFKNRNYTIRSLNVNKGLIYDEKDIQ